MSNPQKAAEFKAKGNEAFKNQNWQQAIDYFTQAIQYNPDDHVFYSNRSGSYCNLGQYQKALQDAEKCIQLNSGFARGYQRKGTALFYLNNLDSAINAYNDGLKVDPNNASLKNDLKAAQQKQNQSAGGFQGMNFGGQNPQFNQQYFNALIKLMQNPETKDMINDPSFMQKVQLVMQNPAAASVLIQQDPQLKKAFQVLSSDAPSTFNFQQMMKNMGKGGPGPNFQQPQPKKEQPKPQSQPKKQQKKQPEAPDVQMKNKGNESYKNKKFQQALSFYEQAIKLNPNEPLYYNNKAAAYIQLKQYQNALNQVSKGEQLFTDGIVKDFVKKAKILARKASILTHLDKLQQAIKAYEQSLIQDQNSKVKDELLKVRKIKKQKDDQAYINPALGQQHCENGNTLFKQGKFPQALAQYEEAIKRNPSVAKYYSNLGTVYVKLMQFPRARDCFDKALSKDAHYIKAYAKKGDCHFFLKQYHKALQTYQAGLKVDPQNQLCKQGVQKTQMAIFTANSQEDQQTRAKRAMQDPQIQQILQTPQVRNALADLQRDPKAINNVMKNPDLARKFQKLIQAGVLRTG